MERNLAIKKLKELEGQNLHDMAKKYDVTVEKDGRQNKGWAGHVCERHLGLPINSAQSPNFGSWELKSFPVIYRNNQVVIKETMAVTMIDPRNVLETPFIESHLLSKLQKAVLVVRQVGENFLEPSYVHAVIPFDLSQEKLRIIEGDYEEIREIIRLKGFDQLTGRMGEFIQPRTKGAGHGSKSRAFYARKDFLRAALDEASKLDIPI